ncbi:uncharacterized protein [Physcomitrium patens]|uniref:uncharacterized protein isoform X2 n=1 Tax=Physcomitrium patens TaxID=3218 RepID=UPI003CCE1092
MGICIQACQGRGRCSLLRRPPTVSLQEPDSDGHYYCREGGTIEHADYRCICIVNGAARHKREGGWCHLSHSLSNFLADNDLGHYPSTPNWPCDQERPYCEYLFCTNEFDAIKSCLLQCYAIFFKMFFQVT